MDESLLAELTEMTPVNLEFTPGGYKNLIHPIYTKWPQKNNRRVPTISAVCKPLVAQMT